MVNHTKIETNISIHCAVDIIHSYSHMDKLLAAGATNNFNLKQHVEGVYMYIAFVY